MSVAVIVPWAASDEWRARAKRYVLNHYRTHHPEWKQHVGTLPASEPWSKGAAVDAAVQRSDADILVLADADSFTDPDTMEAAVRLATEGTPWVVPHRRVHRLTEEFTTEVLAGRKPRKGRTCRPAYTGPAGGGIVVLTRKAYDEVHGIDPRFLDWGGEDVSFGMALETLVGPFARLEGDLFHLWHPHPAPDLRGSPESEELVAKYQAARMSPRRMRAVIAGKDPGPPKQLRKPITFRSENPRKVIRLGDYKARFEDHTFTTTDADIVELLRRTQYVEEV